MPARINNGFVAEPLMGKNVKLGPILAEDA